MIDKKYLIESFDNEKIAYYLNGDWDIENKDGVKLKMPYLSYSDICHIERNVLENKTIYLHCSRWVAMLRAIKFAIENDKLIILLEYLFSKKHLKLIADSKERYMQLQESFINRINNFLEMFDIKIEIYDERIKLLYTVNNEEIQPISDAKLLNQGPVQSNELLNHRILLNLLLFSKSKEEALSWISIIDSIDGYPVELITEIKIRYTSNDFLTFKVVTDELERLFDKNINTEN